MKSVFHVIEGAAGDAWMMLGKRVVMYISTSGKIHIPSDIIAYSIIPDPPP